MDSVLQRIRKIAWTYADYDPAGCAQIESRLAATARAGQLITYADLVRDVTFTLPNVRESPLRLGVPEWTDLHRSILGDVLGRVSCATYEKGGILASAVAIRATTSEPGEGFYALVRELGLFNGTRASNAFLEFWANEVSKAQAWYATQRGAT